jgi:hypothetical protein
MVVGASNMKTKILDFSFGKLSGNTLLGLVISIAIQGNARSQNSIGSEVNGLFTPTQAQQFFREGRRNFERQEQIFDLPEIKFQPNVLKIDPQLLDRLEQTKIWFDRGQSHPESAFEFKELWEN